MLPGQQQQEPVNLLELLLLRPYHRPTRSATLGLRFQQSVLQEAHQHAQVWEPVVQRVLESLTVALTMRVSC